MIDSSCEDLRRNKYSPNFMDTFFLQPPSTTYKKCCSYKSVRTNCWHHFSGIYKETQIIYKYLLYRKSYEILFTAFCQIVREVNKLYLQFFQECTETNDLQLSSTCQEGGSCICIRRSLKRKMTCVTTPRIIAGSNFICSYSREPMKKKL